MGRREPLEIENNDTNLSERTLSLDSDQDLIEIRKYGRSLAEKNGFKPFAQTLIATALSEICRNVIEHAGSGEVTIEIDTEEETCFFITVRDEGPGIDDLEKALKEGFSRKKGLGIGLPGTRRIMDEFDIESSREEGTIVKMCKYLER